MAHISDIAPLVQLLRSAYPRQSWTDDTTVAYTLALEDLDSIDILKDAVRATMKEDHDMPAIADVRRRYFAIAKTRGITAEDHCPACNCTHVAIWTTQRGNVVMQCMECDAFGLAQR